MKGFIYLIMIYALVFSVSLIVKLFLIDRHKNNKGESTTAPPQQIFYIKSANVRRKKPKPKPTDITIRGNIVDNE